MNYTTEELTFIDESVNKTKLRLLFNTLLAESETTLIIRTYFRNGLFKTAEPLNNTILNKYFIKI